MKLSEAEKKSFVGLLVSQLPPDLRSRLLLDERFAKTYDLGATFLFPLDKEVTVETSSLHRALRRAAAGGKSAELMLRDRKPVRAKLGLLARGQATLAFHKKRFSFSNADVLAPTPQRRIRALNRMFGERPLSYADEKRWYSIIKERGLSDQEFLDLSTGLSNTPEALREELQKPGTLTLDSFVPDEPRYYSSLLARSAQSKTLAGFVDNELATERAATLQSHRNRAIRRMAFTAAHQSLIPFGLLKTVKVEEVSDLLKAEDPFSLLFGFELCRDNLENDARFVEVGTALLKKLFDGDQSLNRLNVFSACAIVATPHIRRAAKARSAPVFWARLAALTHAGVLADALSHISDTREFLKWAAESFFPSYTWHGAIDRHEAPRWNPDWIVPEYLFAELVGRANGALHMLPPDQRPAEWSAAIEAGFEHLTKTKLFAAAFFAGPLDDFHEALSSSANEEVFGPIEKKLSEASRLSEVMGLFVLVSTIKPSAEVAQNVLRIIGTRLDEPIAEGDQLPVLHMCARIAASTRSTALSENIIGRCVTAARNTDASGTITDMFSAAVEACGAESDASKHRIAVGETASKFAFAMSRRDDVENIHAILGVLEARDEKLIPQIARARAITETKLRRTGVI